jgi:hypothetical protein
MRPELSFLLGCGVVFFGQFLPVPYDLAAVVLGPLVFGATVAIGVAQLWYTARVPHPPYTAVFGRGGITIDGQRVRIHERHDVVFRDGFLKFGDRILPGADPAQTDVEQLRRMVDQVFADQVARRGRSSDVPRALADLGDRR